MDKAKQLLGEVDKKQPESRHKIAVLKPELKVFYIDFSFILNFIYIIFILYLYYIKFFLYFYI
jgi:hypothetical protein